MPLILDNTVQKDKYTLCWEKRLLIGSAESRSYGLWITHRNKHKSSSLTS